MLVSRLDRWYITAKIPSPYAAPEQGSSHLVGDISGDHRFVNGSRVTTSAVIGKSLSNNPITRSGTEYILGDPDPDYEKAYPLAKDRLINSLPLVK